MKPEWVDLNERTVRLLDELDSMIQEIRGLPIWAEASSIRGEGPARAGEVLAEITKLEPELRECRKMVDWTARVAEPLDFAQLLLGTAVHRHAMVLEVLNFFRGYHGEHERSGSSLN